MKKKIYIILTILLGVVVSFGVHALAEMWFLDWAESSDRDVAWSTIAGKGYCALPIWIQIGMLVMGVVGGYLLGRWWWKLVYVEGKHWRKKRK